jgi:hypothetical protein
MSFVHGRTNGWYFETPTGNFEITDKGFNISKKSLNKLIKRIARQRGCRANEVKVLKMYRG